MNDYLKETRMLDYSNKEIQKLIAQKKWQSLSKEEALKSVYNFVRDEIKFGYNISDDIPASQVLKDSLGQCNTKSTLLMALLRALEIPNRLHGSLVNKELQKGIISGLRYYFAPKNIVHSWVEVYINDRWYALEGVIVDKIYLSKLQEKNSKSTSKFCGYAVYVDDFKKPTIDWNFNDTYIQSLGVNKDFGVFDTPDEFFSTHSQKLGRIKNFIYENHLRHIMNKNVDKIRNS